MSETEIPSDPRDLAAALGDLESHWMVSDFQIEVMSIPKSRLQQLTKSEKQEIYLQWLLLPRDKKLLRSGLPPGWATTSEVGDQLGVTSGVLKGWERSSQFQASLDRKVSESRFGAVQKRDVIDSMLAEVNAGNQHAIQTYARLAEGVNPQTALSQTEADLADLSSEELFQFILDSAQVRAETLGWTITHSGSRTIIDRDPPKPATISPPQRRYTPTTANAASDSVPS